MKIERFEELKEFDEAYQQAEIGAHNLQLQIERRPSTRVRLRRDGQ